MEAFFALLPLCDGDPLVTGGFPLQRPVTRSFDVFFFICAWRNGRANNRKAGDLRRNCAHYDVTVMITHTRIEMEVWFISIAESTSQPDCLSGFNIRANH